MSSQRSRVRESQSHSQRVRSEDSQKTRSDNYSEEQLEAAIMNVTTFLLCDLRNKRKVRKEDIVTSALNKSARQYGAIMKKVKSNLYDIFGLQITKIPNTSDDSFIIVNKHREQFCQLTQELSKEGELQDNLILTIVLASIFMNRGQMFESHMMTILETIGFLSDKFYFDSSKENMKEHVTKLVKNVFVKQMYIDAAVIPRPDQAQNPPLPANEKKVTILRWGYRTYLEVDLDKIVQYLEKINDGKKPTAFPVVYYKELKAVQEQLRAQAN